MQRDVCFLCRAAVKCHFWLYIVGVCSAVTAGQTQTGEKWVIASHIDNLSCLSLQLNPPFPLCLSVSIGPMYLITYPLPTVFRLLSFLFLFFFFAIFCYFFLNIVSELSHLNAHLLSIIKGKHQNRCTGHRDGMTQSPPTICLQCVRGGRQEEDQKIIC